MLTSKFSEKIFGEFTLPVLPVPGGKFDVKSYKCFPSSWAELDDLLSISAHKRPISDNTLGSKLVDQSHEHPLPIDLILAWVTNERKFFLVDGNKRDKDHKGRPVPPCTILELHGDYETRRVMGQINTRREITPSFMAYTSVIQDTLDLFRKQLEPKTKISPWAVDIEKRTYDYSHLALFLFNYLIRADWSTAQSILSLFKRGVKPQESLRLSDLINFYLDKIESNPCIFLRKSNTVTGFILACLEDNAERITSRISISFGERLEKVFQPKDKEGKSLNPYAGVTKLSLIKKLFLSL